MIKTILYLILTIIIGIGAYFLGFNYGREKEILNKSVTVLKENENSIASNSDKFSNKVLDATVPENEDFTDKSLADNSTTENSEGFKEYTVEENDTLFTIGLKFDILWTHIAQANSIDENTPLFIGQKLKIPTDEADQENNQNEETQNFEINLTTAQEEQNKTNNEGVDVWRRDPVEVARREAPENFNLVPGDPYSLVASDLTKGTATVFLQKETKSYTFSLVQPIDKGENGIWKIEKILINKNI